MKWNTFFGKKNDAKQGVLGPYGYTVEYQLLCSIIYPTLTLTLPYP